MKETCFYLKFFNKRFIVCMEGSTHFFAMDFDHSVMYTHLSPVSDLGIFNEGGGKHFFKGCGMGPWLVLVSPCFRENVVATCKIGSFLCSLDNLLQKNVIVFFFGNQISKWRSFEKRAIFDLLFTFFSHQGKVTKIPSAHISLTYIHVFCSPYWPFLPYQFLRIYQIRFLFGMSPVVDSYSRHFGTINK